MGFLHRSILEHLSGIWDTKVKLKIYSLFWCWIFWWWWDFFHHFYVRISVYFSVCQTFRLGRRHVEYFLSPRGSCMKVDQFKKLRFEQLLLNIRPREKTVEIVYICREKHSTAVWLFWVQFSVLSLLFSPTCECNWLCTCSITVQVTIFSRAL